MDRKKMRENLNDITGQDIINAEAKVRAMGDHTPDVTFSKQFQAIIAAKALEIEYDEMLKMKASDFNTATTLVSNFLLGGLVEDTQLI